MGSCGVVTTLLYAFILKELFNNQDLELLITNVKYDTDIYPRISDNGDWFVKSEYNIGNYYGDKKWSPVNDVTVTLNDVTQTTYYRGGEATVVNIVFPMGTNLNNVDDKYFINSGKFDLITDIADCTDYLNEYELEYRSTAEEKCVALMVMDDKLVAMVNLVTTEYATTPKPINIIYGQLQQYNADYKY